MADRAGMPPLFHEPVWYGPLREPDWLLPPLRDGAPRVVFAPTDEAAASTRSSEGRVSASSPSLGLALFLGEALRYSSDARAIVATGPWDAVGAPAAVVRPSFERDRSNRIRIAVNDPDGSMIGEIRH